MTTLLAFIVVLGFLVFVHELGHFLIAKWVGVRVHAFSIGFGPRIWGFKRGDTDYRVSIIPLGGYVKMAGENPGEPLSGAPDEFASRTVLERFGIIFAGPFMNLLWAIILITLVFTIGVDEPVVYKQPPQIGWVQPDSPAAEAGLQRGDVIRRMGSIAVDTWEDVLGFSDSTISRLLPITIERNEQELNIYVEQRRDAESAASGIEGISPATPPVVGGLNPGWPAEKAGIRKGDRIVELNGQRIEDWYQLSYYIHNSPEDSLLLGVQREGKTFSVWVVSRLDKDTGWGFIGMLPYQETEKVQYGLLASLKNSFYYNYRTAGLTLGYLWKVITGRQSGRDIGGPITIAKFAGDAARSGLDDLLRLMGFLSLQLGLLNLLPIPILDGGHIVLLALEGASGKPLSLRMREIIQVIGLVLIAAIMLYALFNDFSRVFG